jgi:hypothetical protein
LNRRPDVAIYNGILRESSFDTLYPYFGFELDRGKMSEKPVTIEGKSYKFNFYEVLRVEEDSFLADMGVAPGDTLGLVYDFFKDRIRYLEVLHVPKGLDLGKLGRVEEYMYYMSKGKYDENIL